MMVLMMQRENVRMLQVTFTGMEQLMMRNVAFILNLDCLAAQAASFTRLTAYLPFLCVGISCSMKLL